MQEDYPPPIACRSILTTIVTTGFTSTYVRKLTLLYSARKRLHLCISTIYLYQISDNRVVSKISIVRVSARQ